MNRPTGSVLYSSVEKSKKTVPRSSRVADQARHKMMPPRPQGGINDEFDHQLNDPGQYDNPQDPASLSVVEHLRALSVRGILALLYVAGAMAYLLLKFDLVRRRVCFLLSFFSYIIRVYDTEYYTLCCVFTTAAVSEDELA